MKIDSKALQEAAGYVSPDAHRQIELMGQAAGYVSPDTHRQIELMVQAAGCVKPAPGPLPDAVRMWPVSSLGC